MRAPLQLAMIAAGLLVAGGCDREPPKPTASTITPQSGAPAQQPAADARPLGPESSAVAPDLTKGWCGGHGVPESVCARCNSSLVAQFKAAGDWCAEHGLPESQCNSCHPEVAARWAALDPNKKSVAPTADVVPSSPTTAPAPTSEPATHPTETPSDAGGGTRGPDLGPWCAEHGVPESVCTRCNPALVARFKADGDWCSEHGLPESQCGTCHPDVRKKWAALRAAQQPPAVPAVTGRPARLLQIENDPFCAVEQTPVRFRDPAVARQAGIAVEPAARRSMTANIEVPGEVDFDRTRLVRITPQVPGVVREVAAPQGTDVSAGDLLAVIESPTLGEAKSKYIELRATLTLAQADFERARVVHDGTQMMLKAAVPETSPDELRKAVSEVRVGAAKSTLLKAHAELLLARSNVAREEQLLQSKAGTQQALDAARAALAAAEAEFYAEREAIAFSIERDLLAAERALHVSRSNLEATERRLHVLGVDEEGIAALEVQGHPELSRYELRASVAGRVVKQHVAVGEAVAETDALLEVADLASMWLIMDAHERDLPLLKTGLPVLFAVEAMNRSFRGEVTWIDPIVDDRTRTIKVRAELPNEDGVLRARMFGRARVAVHENEQVLTVPAGAVQTDGCCQLVFVRQADDLYQPRKVVLGTRSRDFVEVAKGLAEGEAVVTTGSFLLKTEILKSSIGAGCCEVESGR